MKYLILITLIFCILSCTQDNSTTAGLTLIPKDEIVNRVKTGKLDYRFATFKTQSGAALNATEQKMLNDGDLGKDYYEDANGVIKEVIVRPIELEDKFIEIQRRELSNNPMQGVPIMEVDCKTLDSLFTEVFRSDQEAKKNLANFETADAKNLQTVASVISKCGWPKTHIKTMWIILQNAPIGVLANYYDDFKTLSEKGDLSLNSFAMMQDRLLMRHGYEQLYGTEVINGSLYKLEDPERVNERRQKMKMSPIEEYLKIYNLDFEAEVERIRNE